MKAEDENIPESKKFRNEKATQAHQISMQLIADTSLENKMTDHLSEDQK